MSTPKPGHVAIVAHDAGAGNHIISWIRTGHIDAGNAAFCFAGPALVAATKAIPELVNRSLDEVLIGAAKLISGTGWASTLEHDARKTAQARGIPSIAVIDHWTNYRERFHRNGVEVLADEVWVVDEYARQIAERELQGARIELQKNDFVALQVEEARKFHFAKSTATRVLFVMEPIRQRWNDSEVPGEIQAFHYFVDHIGYLALGPVELVVKPHPSDARGKYDGRLSNSRQLDVVVDEDSSLAKLLAWADVVVGCQTYALVVAASLGKKVISSIPNAAPQCLLPQKEIMRLSELMAQHD